MFSYNFRNGYALLSYMEYPIILIQELVLVYCVIYYKNLLGAKSVVGAGIYFTIAGGFLLGALPREFLTFLVVCFCSVILVIKLIVVILVAPLHSHWSV